MEKQGQCLTPLARKLLHKSQKADLRPEYRRRIEIMLLFDTRQSQAQICEALLCAQETARYWIAMAKAGNALGTVPKLSVNFCNKLWNSWTFDSEK